MTAPRRRSFRELAQRREHYRARRRFLKASVSLCGLSVLGGCTGDGSAPVSREITLAPLTALIEPRTIFQLEKLVVFRQNNQIAVMSLNCTHQTCEIVPRGDRSAGYSCPCHGSTFDVEGHVTLGPATADLPYYRAWVDVRGMLRVNLAEVVPKEWRLGV